MSAPEETKMPDDGTTRPAVTPGPWHWTVGSSGGPSIRDAQDRWLADLRTKRTRFGVPLDRETEANADVMAAAPALYAALRDLVDADEHPEERFVKDYWARLA